jgi:hypothetical protein
MPSKQELFEALGQEFDVVSTVDHPYPSPPIHLFDGHLKLHRTYGERVLILTNYRLKPVDSFATESRSAAEAA